MGNRFLIILGVLFLSLPVFSDQNLKSMKGWDLYSWKDKTSKIHYALLPGTNAQKITQQILNADVGGITELKTKLSTLASDEQISWNNSITIDWFQGGKPLKLSLPSKVERKNLATFCKKNHLTLSLSD